MSDRNEKGQFYRGMKGAHTSHGLRNTRFYRIWASMRSRCRNPKTTGYHKYGGKGIKVCVHWNSFENFRDDMLSSYEKHTVEHGERNTSIDRTDVNGDYEPSNCRWATPKEQGRNTTQNKPISFNGRTLTAGAWSEITKIPAPVILDRIRSGWKIERALTAQIGPTSKRYKHAHT